MENNVIYLSDASYDHVSKEAGLGIKNLSTNETRTLFVHAKSVHEAEEFALLEAITHAIEHHHRNCVFVYDNIGLDTKSIGAFFSQMFDRIQFLWMKRDYLSQVDQLASKIRFKHSKHATWTKQIRLYASLISDEELVSALMPLTWDSMWDKRYCTNDETLSNSIKEVNEKIIALLYVIGSQSLQNRLRDSFSNIKCYKHKLYDGLLKASGFDMSWFEEAKYECRAVSRAA